MKKSNLLINNKELMKEYDYEKNDKFDLDTLTLGLIEKYGGDVQKIIVGKQELVVDIVQVLGVLYVLICKY